MGKRDKRHSKKMVRRKGQAKKKARERRWKDEHEKRRKAAGHDRPARDRKSKPAPAVAAAPVHEAPASSVAPRDPAETA